MRSKNRHVAKNKKLKRDFEPNIKTLSSVINNKPKTTIAKQILILPVIIWDKNRFLKWNDFQKKPDSKSKGSASSAIGFESQPFIEHIKTGSKFQFKIKDMQLHAIFIPDFSWVKRNVSKSGSTLLLKHEQGHFDLAEEITRKTRIKTTDRFQNKVFDVQRKNENKAKKYSISKVVKIRKIIDDKLQKDLKKQEAKYDYETNHGLIVEYQEKYNKRFNRLRA